MAGDTTVQLMPDSPEHDAAYTAARRAHEAGYQPIIVAGFSKIWVMLACTPEQIHQLLDTAEAPHPPPDTGPHHEP